jgi:hypothetical protein
MENMQTPINSDVVQRRLVGSGLNNLANASIREIKRLVDLIEADSGQKFVRMEMGIPGLPALQVGVDAQIQALKDGVAAV